MQILRTSNEISTPEKLARLISDASIARYMDIPIEHRLLWLGSEIYGLCFLLHYQTPAADDVEMDVTFADQMIMADEGLRCLKQVEMQEAFRRGIAREYGEFYGVTASSLVGFLKAYRQSEKRAKALGLLYRKEQKKLNDGDALLFKTLAEAQEKKLINIPELIHSPFEDDKQHQERIAKQREAILKAMKDAEE